MEKPKFEIEVKNLVKKYGDITAVDDISFTVREGKIFAFLGPNGAGKTTAIKMLTTLLKPTGGKILVNGYDPVKNPYNVRCSFGIVFQDPSLDEELTAYENLQFHGVLYGVTGEKLKKEIKKLLELVELWDRRNEFVKNYSGGMKRRLEIARSLIHNPKILFLDEPTLGLDPQTRNHIWSYIKKLSDERQMTIFFTTHYMDEAEKVAEKIAIIDYGKIKVQGSPQELLDQTKTKTLEEAFLKLTGKEIREQKGSAADRMRTAKRAWGR
jgi:ABC-2 type transport system ATP-binding protein